MLVQKNRDIKNICSKSKWGECMYNDIDLQKNDFYMITRDLVSEEANSNENIKELTQLEL